MFFCKLSDRSVAPFMSAKARRRALLSSCVLLHLGFAGSAAYATCDNIAPGSNTVVTCTPDELSPDLVGAQALVGTSDVTINVQKGAKIDILDGKDRNAVSVFKNSTITNNGEITAAGGGAQGMLASESGNVLINNNMIRVADSGYAGMAAEDLDGEISDNKLVNNGDINIGFTSNGKVHIGILLNANRSSLINNGRVAGSGRYVSGIYTRGDDLIATNNGWIDLKNENSQGMFHTGNQGHLINTGRISIEGGVGDILRGFYSGIVIYGDDNTISNSGEILTLGDLVDGAFIRGSNNKAFNTGKISSSGANSSGVAIGYGVRSGSGNLLTNSGSITATGLNSAAVQVTTMQGGTDTIINTESGIIKSEQSFTIQGSEGRQVVDNAGTLIGNFVLAADDVTRKADDLGSTDDEDELDSDYDMKMKILIMKMRKS